MKKDSVSIAIVDDEKEMTDSLVSALQRFASENKVNLLYECFPEGLSFLEKNKEFDLVFMDIEMPTMDGMSVAMKLREVNTDIALVFITKTAYFAINGYQVNAIDYVLKPVKWGRFETLMKKTLPLLEKKQNSTLSLKTSGGFEVIRIEDIVYIEINEHLITIYLNNGKAIDTWGSLNTIEESIRDYDFYRCNRKCIINLHYVSSLKKTDILLAGQYHIALSIGRRSDFQETFSHYLESRANGPE